MPKELKPSEYHRNWAFSSTIAQPAPLTAETLQKAFDSVNKRMKENANKPDRYWTRCLSCGRQVLAVAYTKVEKCPICD